MKRIEEFLLKEEKNESELGAVTQISSTFPDGKTSGNMKNLI